MRVPLTKKPTEHATFLRPVGVHRLERAVFLPARPAFAAAARPERRDEQKEAEFPRSRQYRVHSREKAGVRSRQVVLLSEGQTPGIVPLAEEAGELKLEGVEALLPPQPHIVLGLFLSQLQQQEPGGIRLIEERLPGGIDEMPPIRGNAKRKGNAHQQSFRATQREGNIGRITAAPPGQVMIREARRGTGMVPQPRDLLIARCTLMQQCSRWRVMGIEFHSLVQFYDYAR